MKNIKTTLVFTVVIVCVFFGCRPKPIDIDIDLHKPKLVVSSTILPLTDSILSLIDSTITDSTILVVSLTKTFSALSNPMQNDSFSSGIPNNLVVTDALVTVNHSNRIDTLFMIVPGIYISTFFLQDYEYYTLYAKDPATKDEITASSVLLPKVSFDTVYPIVTKIPNDTTISVKYEFTDFQNTNNWYVISCYNYFKTSTTVSKKKFDINNYRDKYKLQTKLILLNDKTFEGKKYSGETILTDVKSADTIVVSISNISEEYFQFLTTQKRSGSIFNQFTGEPINFPTNVNNGYGYFNLYYLDSKIFELKDY
ncbi:MAG: DUF4249 domain-containing protein [Bacteroidota bacterium]